MPERAELRRKTGQRGLLNTSYKMLKKDSIQLIKIIGKKEKKINSKEKKNSDRAITPAVETCLCPYTLGTTKVATNQAAEPLSCSALME